jgi:hypothetical protein
MPRKPRKPTPAQLRRAYRAAGYDWVVLKRWIVEAVSETKKTPGPKPYAEPLLYIEALCRALEQQGMSRNRALTQLVRDTGIRGRGVESSIVKRLRDKLRDPQFQREFREKVVIKHYPRPAKVAELLSCTKITPKARDGC